MTPHPTPHPIYPGSARPAAKTGSASNAEVDRVKLLDHSSWETTVYYLGGSLKAPGSATLEKLVGGWAGCAAVTAFNRGRRC